MKEARAPDATSAAMLADAAVGVLTVAVNACVDDEVVLDDVPDDPPPQDAANAATRQHAVIRHDRVLHFKDELMVIPPGNNDPARIARGQEWCEKPLVSYAVRIWPKLLIQSAST